MITDQRMASGGLPSPWLLIDRANHLIQTLATPSLDLLVLRLALAVPFWRSGMLKWGGFLRLNDTAVTLFSDEFMLHLPGGPYHFPAPTLMAFLSGCGEIMVDEHLRTTVPGLYAIGDVVNGINQISVATGHAAVASTDVHNSLPSLLRQA